MHRLYAMRRNAFVLLTALCLVAGYHVSMPDTAAGHMVLEGLPAVLIDAGHGGFDGGAVSKDQVLEKSLNLSVAEKLDLVLLSQGVQVVMTRREDEALTLEGKTGKSADLRARAKLAQEYPDAILISIHMNKFEEAKYDGSQVFYSTNHPDSQVLAECIQTSIRESLQPENTRQIKPAGREIYLLTQAQQPAVLVECGFLSNLAETQRLLDEDYQQSLAQAIANGLQTYYNQVEEEKEQADVAFDSAAAQGVGYEQKQE